jgi:hypothetical protein
MNTTIAAMAIAPSRLIDMISSNALKFAINNAGARNLQYGR